jgi:hypothetical protein
VTAAVNDVGIVTLPEGRGHLAMAIFVKGSHHGPRRVERVIATLARAAYDYWAGPVVEAEPPATNGPRAAVPMPSGEARPSADAATAGQR